MSRLIGKQRHWGSNRKKISYLQAGALSISVLAAFASAEATARPKASPKPVVPKVVGTPPGVNGALKQMSVPGAAGPKFTKPGATRGSLGGQALNENGLDDSALGGQAPSGNALNASPQHRVILNGRITGIEF